MIKKISDKIWKLKANSNIYFLDFDKKIIIDTGDRAERRIVEQFLSKLVDFDKIDIVIFTHLHYDHVGNFDLFKKAKFYASKQAIKDLERDGKRTIYNDFMAEKFDVKLEPIPEKIEDLEVIKTPGHTRGSICLWYGKEKILFSGDTLFGKTPGRTDLPTSSPEQMKKSLMKLVNYNFRILAPGHDY
jgi:hydroxyacylglutathione hydrolase